MKKRYLNAMALMQRYGKLDIFLKITCNENWPKRVKSDKNLYVNMHMIDQIWFLGFWGKISGAKEDHTRKNCFLERLLQ